MKSKQKSNPQTLPNWWIVAARELADLWMGTRALTMLILFSILMGVMTFLLATNSELSLIPPKEMLFLTLQATIAIGLFIGLSIGADSISGERERATLEGLLLTPAKRREIVVGKFLATISPWPAVLAVAIPYLMILAPEGEVLGLSLLWGSLLGTVLVVSFSGFGMLVSFWANSNKTSLSLSLVVYLIFLLPTQFPGTAQAGTVGQFVKKINPMESTNQFLEKVIVNNRTPEEMASWLTAPIAFALLVLGLLFWYAAPNLQLSGGRAKIRNARLVRPVSFFLIAILIVSFTSPPLVGIAAQSDITNFALQINIDTTYEIVKTGDSIEFSTQVIYEGQNLSPEMVVAMNIVNLGDGDPVDPEDWSPERTQSIEPLEAGESVTQEWTVRAILDGDYLVYMVVLPTPDNPETTSQPIASTGIHLTVNPFTQYNPGGILPVAIGMPIGLSLLMVFFQWRRRKSIE